jgi:hypothetical protein
MLEVKLRPVPRPARLGPQAGLRIAEAARRTATARRRDADTDLPM